MSNFLAGVAPYFAWVFAVTLILHFRKNIISKVYSSGSVVGWIIAGLAHTILCIYMVFIGEIIIASQQGFSGLLAYSLVVQSFIYKHNI
jgi:hypothetical protein